MKKLLLILFIITYSYSFDFPDNACSSDKYPVPQNTVYSTTGNTAYYNEPNSSAYAASLKDTYPYCNGNNYGANGCFYVHHFINVYTATIALINYSCEIKPTCDENQTLDMNATPPVCVDNPPLCD